jgi:hypothetical protein
MSQTCGFRSDGRSELRGALVELANCIVCLRRDGAFLSGTICAVCRSAVARVILSCSPQDVATVWQVTEKFAQTRQKVCGHDRKGVEPQVLAAVADGLAWQGLGDDGLVYAALAIELGEASDVNRVGASALAVIFAPSLARPDMLPHLRTLVGRDAQ